VQGASVCRLVALPVTQPYAKDMQSTQPNHKNWPHSSFIYHLTSDRGERQS